MTVTIECLYLEQNTWPAMIYKIINKEVIYVCYEIKLH